MITPQSNPDINDVVRDRTRFLGLGFDRLDRDAVLDRLAARTDRERFSYIVTPNVQHVVAADRDPRIRRWLDEAWLSLCDSRPVRKLAAWRGTALPLVTGADLTVDMFARVIRPGDRIAVICASRALGTALRAAHPDLDWHIHVPPKGAEPGTPAFSACIRFVVRTRARFCFVCLGAPKSEAICHAAASTPGAAGLGLCTGAALEFMLGVKRRAPRVVQRMGLEWAHRLSSEPRRLARRYVSAVIPLVGIWLRTRPVPDRRGGSGAGEAGATVLSLRAWGVRAPHLHSDPRRPAHEIRRHRLSGIELRP